MDNNYEYLQPSFSLGDTFAENGSNIDFLCETYLGDLNSLPVDLEVVHYPAMSHLNSRSHGFSSTLISQWLGEDCQQWAEHSLRRNNIDPIAVDLWQFGTLDGHRLLGFSCQDFCQLAGENYGSLLYREFHLLKNKQSGIGFGSSTSRGTHSHTSMSQAGGSSLGVMESREIAEDPVEDFGDSSYLYEPLTDKEVHELGQYIPDDVWPPSGGAFQEPSQMGATGVSVHGSLMDILGNLELEEPLQLPEGNLVLPEGGEAVAVGGARGTITRGSPALPIPSEEMLGKLPSRNKKRVRGPKNWEFLMRLLVDPRTNPSLIEWEDETNATFRLKQPEIIARMWASRNQGETGDLSYNNFARGLRHHYKSGTLEPIPERQLVYRCGPKALEFLDTIRDNQP